MPDSVSLRIGFVLVVSSDDEVDGLSDAGVALFRLLNYISEEYDEAQAFTSMVSVSAFVFAVLCFKSKLVSITVFCKQMHCFVWSLYSSGHI